VGDASNGTVICNRSTLRRSRAAGGNLNVGPHASDGGIGRNVLYNIRPNTRGKNGWQFSGVWS